SFLAKECRAAEDCKDMTQDVFFKLWKARTKLSGVESLKSYLFTVTRNTFIDHIRKRVNQQIFEELTNYPVSELPSYDKDDQELIDELITYAEGMPQRRLEVFKLRWLEGKSRKEIAEQLNISIVTVDIHIRKALEYLKEKAEKNKLLAILLLFI
ncbi:MAG: sigma-70 family RNA polymerase sigma factor, partial [Tannerellaceae bacterium]|nr:sigma-70 family RNA polymerase sigma factor [Tannerellaceae bacterium]